jgi:hypothetical protein
VAFNNLLTVNAEFTGSASITGDAQQPHHHHTSRHVSPLPAWERGWRVSAGHEGRCSPHSPVSIRGLTLTEHLCYSAPKRSPRARRAGLGRHPSGSGGAIPGHPSPRLA